MSKLKLALALTIFLMVDLCQAQNLLDTNYTYVVMREIPSVSQGISVFSSFYGETIVLESIKGDTSFYKVQRREIYNPWQQVVDSLDYQLALYDSAIYFTGRVGLGNDSSIYFKDELIFDYKLNLGDELEINSNWNGEKVLLKVISKDFVDSTKSVKYDLKIEDGHFTPGQSIITFDSRFGFEHSGLLPYEIAEVNGGGWLSLISVCSDSNVYFNSELYKTYNINSDYCDSALQMNLFRSIIKSSDNLLETNGEANIYPNPFSDYLMVETEEHSTIEIYNVHGHKILEGVSNQPIKTSHLRKGFYFVRVYKGNGVSTYSIVK